MKILGIDPGFERLGVAVVEKVAPQPSGISNSRGLGGVTEKLIFSECFKTSAQLEFPERLNLIGEEVKKIIKKYKPDILAIETLFFTTNQKTAMHVAEVRGVIIYEAMQKNLKILEITPLQVKVAITGYGKADKKQISSMLKHLIKIDENKSQLATRGDDELDAIAIALTGLAHLSTVSFAKNFRI
ncbi:MAG: crossover junction endodeoxyribonuclease RuvC [Patescibacteria group bacterium]